MTLKPKINSASERELIKVEEQFNDYKEQIEGLSLDRMNMVPKTETEEQTKLSQEDLAKSKDIYLKPHRAIGSQEKFNEKWREDYNEDKKYTQFVAENVEIIGESIDIWCKPYPGLPAEWWKVPVNKPVWGPRYLENQLKNCNYHVFSMNQRMPSGMGGEGQYYGAIVVDDVKQRLDARPVSTTRRVFMGARNFR